MSVRVRAGLAAMLTLHACTVSDPSVSRSADRRARRIPVVASLEWQARLVHDTLQRYAWDGQPAVTEHNVVVAAPTGVVTLDRASGQIVWADSVWQRAGIASVTADERHVCVGSRWLGCYDLSSGRRLWGVRMAGDNRAGPHALAEDIFVVLADDGYVRAYDIATGAVRWATQAFPLVGEPALLGGVVANDSVAFVTGAATPMGPLIRASGVTAAFRVRDGTMVWRSIASDSLAGSITPPILADTLLIVSDIWARTVRALDTRTGRTVWTSDRSDLHNAAITSLRSVTVSGDTVYLGSMDQNIYGLSLATGRTIFKYRTVASVEHVTTCGRWIAFSVLRVGFLDPGTRAVHWSPNDASLDDTFNTDTAMVTSDLARSPDYTTLYYTTARGVTAVSCTH